MRNSKDRGRALTRMLCWLAVLSALAPTSGLAQGAGGGSAPVRVIVSPGLALGGGAELESGVGAVAHLALERGRHRVLVRTAVLVDVAGFPDGSGDGNVSELGVLYGRRGGGAGPGWSLSAGLSAVHFQRCPEDPVDSFYDPGCTTLGVPLVAEAGIGGKVAGIAVQAFGNLNTQAPFAGVGLTVSLGWMP